MEITNKSFITFQRFIIEWKKVKKKAALVI